MPRPDPENVERVAVLGAGTIGASWTALFLTRGLAVRVYDPDPDIEQRLRASMERAGRPWSGWGRPPTPIPASTTIQVEGVAPEHAGALVTRRIACGVWCHSRGDSGTLAVGG